jgi:WD40 repeat protein
LKKRIILIVSLVLLLVAGLCFFIWWPRATPLKLWSVAFSPNGKLLVTAGGQDSPDTLPQIGEVVIWNAGTGKKKRIIQQQWGVRHAVFAPDGKSIATADFGGKTKLLDPASGKVKAILAPQFVQVNAVVLSPDGKLIAYGSFDGTVTLCDQSGKVVGKLTAPNEQILNLAISPDAQWLVVGCKRGKAYLFNLGQPTAPKVLEAYVGPPSFWSGIEAVAFAPNGETFVTGGVFVRLWQTSTGALIREMPRASQSRVNDVAFSPDGLSLAGVDRDGWLALWDPSTGELIKSIQAHKGASFGLCFSPDGRRLATVARPDFAIRIWDSSLSPLATFYRANAPR